MKNYILILVATLTIFGCKRSGDKGYTLSATIENAEGKMVYLEDISSPNVVVLDTAKILDGKVNLNGIATEGLYRFRLIPTNENIILYLPEGKSKIELSFDKNAPHEYTISGNKESENIKKLHEELVLITADYNELKNSLITQPENAEETEAEMNEILKKLTNSLKSFIEQNENGFLKTYALTMLPNPNDEIDYIEAQLKPIVEANPKNEFAKSVYQEVEKFKNQREMESNMGLGIGKEAPEIILPDVNGKTRKLSSLRGKVVLIDFWAAWCKPCRMENPNVVRVYNKYKDQGFEVFSVSLDKDKSAWLNAIREDGLIWQNHVGDLKFWNSEVVPLYNIKGIPMAILIDAEGKIIAKNLRGQALDNRLAEIFN